MQSYQEQQIEQGMIEALKGEIFSPGRDPEEAARIGANLLPGAVPALRVVKSEMIA